MAQTPLTLAQLTSCTNKELIMERIEVNVQTGERKVVELTAEEVAQAQAQYQEWLASQPTKEEQIAKLQEQIDALKGT